MKRILLFLTVILPAFALGQSDLVRWNNTNNTPSIVNANVTAGNLTVAGGVSLTNISYDNLQNWFQTGSWPSDNALSTTKYVEFSITASAGYKIDLDRFRFRYQAQGTSQNFQVRASKNNFSTYTSLLGNTAISNTTWVNSSLSLAAVSPVLPGETVKIRIYVYNTYNNFNIKRVRDTNNANNHSETPRITGTVSVYVPTLTANADTASAITNNFTDINVLENDLAGNNPITGVAIASQPSSGSVAVNPDNTIRYTAGSSPGNTSFTYTITDGTTTTAPATVSVSVTNPVVSELVKWRGTGTSPNPDIIASGIGANAINGPASTNFTTTNWSNPFNNFQGSNYPTSTTTPDYTKYMEVSISANSGREINLSELLFNCRADANSGASGATKLEVRYATDFASSPNGNGTLLVTNSTVSSTQTLSKSISLSSVTVASGTTLYIRIYPYGRTDTWSGSRFYIEHSLGGNTGPTITGTVLNAIPCVTSTAPTAIAGESNVCPGSSITLTASGGTVGTGSVYEWGTGTAPNNIIAGQTTAVLTHTPTASSTTYWVRRKDAANCGGASTAAITKVVTSNPQGNQTTYGSGAWIGYVYADTNGGNPPSNAFTTTYKGFVNFTEMFDANYGAGAISGENLCGTYTDNFAIRARMTQTFPAGNYTFTVGGDDGYRLSVDGGSNYIISNWDVHAYEESVATVYLNGTTNLVLEYFENGGQARLKFDYIFNCVPTSTAPTSISGNTTVCAGTNTTLTAVGATLGAGATYQWGTGTVGSNIIAGQTAAAITVSPTATTTYWVRTVEPLPCNVNSDAATVVVTVGAVGDPTVFGNNVWNVYGYNETNLYPSASNYQGYYTQSSMNVDTQALWDINASPSSAATWNGCALGNDNFTIVHKRRGFTPGSYELRMNNWDDATRVIVDGVQVFDNAGWYGGVELNQLIGVYCLHANSTIEIRTIENGGGATVRMTFVPVTAIYNGDWNISQSQTTAEIQSSIDLASDLSICTCTIKAGSTLTVKSGTSLVVEDFINVEAGATLIVEDDANLIQVNNNAVNTGVAQIKRESSTVKKFDYVYYSAPVSGVTMGAVASPSIYYRFEAGINNWISMASTNFMLRGRGYIVRAPNSLFPTPQTLTTVNVNFNGSPNNGIYEVPLTVGAQSRFNLVGNPYPSAIDAEVFIAENQDLITGTLYFWTHKSAISSSIQGSEANNYSADDYAIFNLTGSVGTGLVGQGSDNGTENNAPTKEIASCQGFFVEVDPAAVAPLAPLVFNNAMRSSGDNSNFYKPAPTTPDATVYKNRLWVNITNTQGAYAETLVGYITGATNGLDKLYDGKALPAGNFVSIYSLLDTQPLKIQGRALPFNDTDVIPLGYSSTIAGTFSISLSQFDGVFNAQAVYLVDKTTNTYTNLKDINYTFQTAIGTFTNRFELRFVPDETLGNDTPVLNQDAVTIFKTGSQIQVTAKETSLKQVLVYDLLGRTILDQKNINARTFTTTALNVGNQVVIVKVIDENDAELVKKVMMN